MHVAFEEGTQVQWLHDLLAPLVERVVVCDRHGEPRRGNKGDRVDADQLSARLWRGELRAVYHGSADRATLIPSWTTIDRAWVHSVIAVRTGSRAGSGNDILG